MQIESCKSSRDKSRNKNLRVHLLGFMVSKECMVFVQEQYQYLTHTLQQKQYVIKQFNNQEFFLQLDEHVRAERCVIIGSLTAPADQVIALLLLLHTLKQQGALQTMLFSPYLGYQRQDTLNIHQSHGLQWADALLHAVGVCSIITIEAHNPLLFASLQVPILSHTSQAIFQEDMAHFVALGFGFVFPDQGAYKRHHWVVENFPSALCGYFVKQRVHDMIQIQEFYGRLGRKVIVYDDILDSGQTLVVTCMTLKQLGVEEIVIFVTHAFFHGDAWHQLWEMGVKLLYCTNSLPAAHTMKNFPIIVKSIDFFLQTLV